MGDSIVANAGKNEDQLPGGGRTIGSSLSGARRAAPNGTEADAQKPGSTTLVLHIGPNDILKSPTWGIGKRIKENIKGVRQLLLTLVRYFDQICIRR